MPVGQRLPPSFYRRRRVEKTLAAGGILATLGAVCSAFAMFLALPFIAIAALVTHVIVCIKAGAWLLLLAGAIAFPIGVIHGICVWLGVL